MYLRPLNVILPTPCISESSLKIKINLSAYIHSFLWCLFEFTNQDKVTFFSARTFFSFPLPRETCALPFDFVLDREPKNIFYYQRDVKNYTDQVLDFLSIDRHECTHGIFRSVILCYGLM